MTSWDMEIDGWDAEDNMDTPMLYLPAAWPFGLVGRNQVESIYSTREWAMCPDKKPLVGIFCPDFLRVHVLARWRRVDPPAPGTPGCPPCSLRIPEPLELILLQTDMRALLTSVQGVAIAGMSWFILTSERCGSDNMGLLRKDLDADLEDTTPPTEWEWENLRHTYDDIPLSVLLVAIAELAERFTYRSVSAPIHVVAYFSNRAIRARARNIGSIH